MAEAQAAPPQVVEAPCAALVNGSFYAEAAFPGRTANELARAEALVHYTTPLFNDYTWAKSTFSMVKDGAVLALCYPDGASNTADFVRVILPAS